MKKLITFFLILACLQYPVFSQTIRSLLPDQVLKRPDTISVMNNSSSTTERITSPGSFRLRPGEVNAVAVTGQSMIKIDTAAISAFKDTVTNAGFHMIPELYYAKNAETNTQVMYRIIYVGFSPLRYDFDSEAFKGSVRILAVDAAYSGTSQPQQVNLASGEEIMVAYGSTSVPLVINSLNWPPRDVMITSANPIDSLEVRILTKSKPDGYAKYLPVEPAIVLAGKRASIQGFGLQTMPVYVSLKGVTSYRPVSFVVQTSIGSVDPSSLKLEANTTSEVRLRSESYGKINVDITNTDYQHNSISVNAIIPWLFLLLAIGGGMIGGIGSRLTGPEKLSVRVLLYSAIYGLTAAVLWSIGINVLNIPFESRVFSEAVVFGIGLIAGFTGISLIHSENKKQETPSPGQTDTGTGGGQVSPQP